ncbi:gp436 family protein [Gallibacterium sp. AGMB14963]|uniref:gp436 family protein n=1 Tax=Gallibacterium faecale TaxID=3019086 RepID=UPI0022F147AF|nr:DUF1320 domain-containing protein [Gallibacterium sp. AGMB14963]MDA3977899.1 DUF1320 domain-containing protein [Gallibacterium sp. AGMB14963]
MYITADMLIAAFGRNILVQLSNDDSRATEIALPVINAAIQVASERIDAALRSRYQLPLTETPTVISQHCLSLARYWLYARRPETKMPETVKETYQQAIKELEHIATGKLHLGVATLDEARVNDLLLDSGEFKVRSAQKLNTDSY